MRCRTQYPGPFPRLWAADGTDRQSCGKCLPIYREESGTALVKTVSVVLAQACEKGQDRVRGAQAGTKRAETQARWHAERATREPEHGDGEEERARFVA